MVVVLLVSAREGPSSDIWHPQRVSCPAEILSDEEVFHRRDSCPIENFYVSHFVLPFAFDWH